MRTLTHLVTHRNADCISCRTPDDAPAGEIRYVIPVTGRLGARSHWHAKPAAGLPSMTFHTQAAAEYYMLAAAIEAAAEAAS